MLVFSLIRDQVMSILLVIKISHYGLPAQPIPDGY